MHAQTIQPSLKESVAGGRAEHISLESDADEAPAPVPKSRRRTRSSYVLRSPLHGCETGLCILEDHHVSVRSIRPHAAATLYEFDLRFLNPRPVRIRRVSWFWLLIGAGLAILAGGALLSMTRAADSSWLDPVFLAAITTLAASFCALFLFLRRTTESLEFTSAHGAVTLISVTGGIGSARGGRKFFVELIRSINAAKAARPQPRQQLLRDEMREHHRLRELNVLTQEQYEAGKARILTEWEVTGD